MTWDQVLLKKFSFTGHFRLLNQVRGELKVNPLVRDPLTRVLILQAKSNKNTTSRINKRPNVLDNEQKSMKEASNQKDNLSFRDKLNSIEVR